MTRWKTFFILAFLVAALSLSSGHSAFGFSGAGFSAFAPAPEFHAITPSEKYQSLKEISPGQPQTGLDMWLDSFEAFARAA